MILAGWIPEPVVVILSKTFAQAPRLPPGGERPQGEQLPAGEDRDRCVSVRRARGSMSVLLPVHGGRSDLPASSPAAPVSPGHGFKLTPLAVGDGIPPPATPPLPERSRFRVNTPCRNPPQVHGSFPCPLLALLLALFNFCILVTMPI